MTRNQILSALRGLALNLSAAGAADLDRQRWRKTGGIASPNESALQAALHVTTMLPGSGRGRGKGEPDTGSNHLGLRCVKPRLP
ncbi:MAG: hypothetical protein ABSH41_06695 [Syntrophobacteraceae bacterium]